MIGLNRSHDFAPSRSSKPEPLAESIRPFSDRRMPSNPSPAVQKASSFSQFFTLFFACVSMPDVSKEWGRRTRAAGDPSGPKPVPLPDELSDYRLNILWTRVPFVRANCTSDENVSARGARKSSIFGACWLFASINRCESSNISVTVLILADGLRGSLLIVTQ